MVRSCASLLTVVVLAFAGTAVSTELEIDLGLATPDDPYTIQVVPVSIDIPAEHVSQISLRLQGTFHDQFFLCGATPGLLTLTASSRFAVWLGDEVLASPVVEVVHSFPANPGDPQTFDIQILLFDSEADDWSIFTDGQTQLGFSDFPRTVLNPADYLSCTPGNVFGNVTGSTLLVTYDSGVPVGSMRWSAVKAIYR